MEIILYSTAGLLLLAFIMVAAVVRKHNRMFNDSEDPIPFDDIPGHYDDYEVCERPYIEML